MAEFQDFPSDKRIFYGTQTCCCSNKDDNWLVFGFRFSGYLNFHLYFFSNFSQFFEFLSFFVFPLFFLTFFQFLLSLIWSLSLYAMFIKFQVWFHQVKLSIHLAFFFSIFLSSSVGIFQYLLSFCSVLAQFCSVSAQIWLSFRSVLTQFC